MAERKFDTHMVACEGGLNTQLSALVLGRPEFNGVAAGLTNFEPADGYRRVEGFTQILSTSGFVGSGSVAGLEIYKEKILAARRSADTTFRLYESTTSANVWTTITAADITFAADAKVRFHEFNWAGDKVAFVDGTSNAKTWNNSAVVTLNGSGVLAAPSVVTSFKSRLVLSGDTTKPYIVSLSAANDETNWSGAAGSIDINIGDKVTQVKRFRDELVIFCTNSIHKIVGDSSANFVAQPVTSDLGCLAPDSVIEIGGDLYFWGADGLRSFKVSDNNNDTNLSPITIPIRPSIRAMIDSEDIRTVAGLNIRNKSQFRMFCSDATSTEAKVHGFLGTLNISSAANKPNASRGDTPAWEFALLRGINPSCATSGYIGGKEFVLHGGWDGVVYRQESGNKFGAAKIVAVYDTPFMDLTDPFVRKTLHRLMTYLKVQGATTIYMRLRFDFGDGNIVQSETQKLELNSVDAIYDDSDTRYGTAKWGIVNLPFNLQNVRGSCKTVSIRILSIDDQQAFAIHGFALEYEKNGRH